MLFVASLCGLGGACGSGERPATTTVVAETRVLVDDAGDAPDAEPGDGRCASAEGTCTLRAAIATLNETPGGEIGFDLPLGPGPAIIQPRAPLPAVEVPAVIDGTTQRGSRPNASLAPAPFDGLLRVQLDGEQMEGEGAGLVIEGRGSVVRGIVVSGFDGVGIWVAGDGSSIEGSYIGTDASGLVDRGNRGAGVSGTATDVRLGGPAPEQRTLISGNDDNASYPRSGWVVQGSYLGVGADGATPIGNGIAGFEGSGALSIDDADDVVVGGDGPGELNVISANASYGVAPLRVRRLRIVGNLVGVAADGRTPLGNGSAGILLSDGEEVEIAGNTVMHNGSHGVLVASSTETTVGGPGRRANTVSGNRTTNIAVWALEEPNRGVEVIGNRVGTGVDGEVDATIDNEIGISVGGRSEDTVVGGSDAADANLIVGGSGPAVAILELRAVGSDTVVTPSRTAVLRNEVRRGEPTRNLEGASPTPIDVAVAWDTSSPLDLVPDRFDGAGRSELPPRAVAFGDVAPPVVELARGSDRSVAVVRPAGRPGQRFRVELFSVDDGSTTATWVGAATVTAGAGVEIEVDRAAPPGLGFVAATATLLDRESVHGFGSTSELSVPIPRS